MYSNAQSHTIETQPSTSAQKLVLMGILRITTLTNVWKQKIAIQILLEIRQHTSASKLKIALQTLTISPIWWTNFAKLNALIRCGVIKPRRCVSQVVLGILLTMFPTKIPILNNVSPNALNLPSSLEITSLKLALRAAHR